MSLPPEHRRWLDAAARQAAPFLGTTGELPAAAAILVDTGTQTLLGRAVAVRGGPSAEALAIAEASGAARRATLYLTLGPSPAGADAILAAGVARVVIGTANSAATTARQRLAAAGIEVVAADHAPSQRLHEGYFARLAKGRPFVTARLAVSADDKVGRMDGAKTSILGGLAERWAAMQRALSDAVLTGWASARAEASDLGVGLDGLADRKPLRVLVAGLRTRDARLPLFATAPGHPALIVAISEKKLEPPPGVELVRVAGQRGRPELPATLAVLAARGISNLFVETGPTLLDALLSEGLVDRFHLLRGEVEVGVQGLRFPGRGGIEARLGAVGFSLVDHRVLGADNLRTFERVLQA